MVCLILHTRLGGLEPLSMKIRGSGIIFSREQQDCLASTQGLSSHIAFHGRINFSKPPSIMRNVFLVIVSLTVSSSPLCADSKVNVPSPTAYRVVGKDANHKIWQRETFEKAPDGRVVTKIHKYTELAGGMHYKDANGNWVESKEEIEIYPKGAIARQGRYQVIFAENLNSEGSIDLQTSDGKRLRSNVLGLSYYDHSTGDTVLIAQVQDSAGELVSSNQVIYANAFDGLNADLRYTYKRAFFEQDIILHASPPTPEAYGLKSESTELVVMTEFITAPEETIKNREIKDGFGGDQDISWGAMRTGRGRAFDFGESKRTPSQISVRKQYATVKGRKVLLEWVPIKNAVASLNKLPGQASTGSKPIQTASNEWQLPAARLAKLESKPMKLAASTLSNQGFVLDYVLIDADQADFTFQADTTYYLSDVFMFTGTTTFEGGTVVKLSGWADIYMYGGDIVCKTAPYRPAVFTSVNDNSVGESIGSGSPAYGDVYSFLEPTDSSPYLHDMRFSYCQVAVNLWSSSMSVDIRNCQFVEVGSAVWGNNSVAMHNVLISCSTNAPYGGAVYLAGNHFTGENITSDKGLSFVYFSNAGGNTLKLTNSIIVGTPYVTNGGAITTYVTNHVVHLPTLSTPVFETVGAGSYYLTNSSPYRNAGTMNIDPATLADLSTKTTYPPVVYSNTTVSIATTFAPQAQRDNDTPDLGYHYDPLDYAFGGTYSPSNITFLSGTAVAWFELPDSWGAGYGINIENEHSLEFQGTVSDPCHFVRYSVVQEGGNGLWNDKGWLAGIIAGGSYDPASMPRLSAFFTKFSRLSSEPGHLRDYGNNINVVANHCEFYGGFGGYNINAWLTNCLMYRGPFGHSTADSAYAFETYRSMFVNCTFYGGSLEFGHWESEPYWRVLIQNCAFDGTALYLHPTDSGMDWLTSDYNATNTSVTYGGSLLPGGHNRAPAGGSYSWQSSWFGDFYLPSNSVCTNNGSVTASSIGLYHFTTQTNQAKETNSIVDIGYHYVATDIYGNPIDTDKDGSPDYLEDASGAGLLSIILVSPVDNSYYSEPANIPILGVPSGWAGPTNVTFFREQYEIGSKTNSPFSIQWPIVGSGSYILKAVATIPSGITFTSPPVSIFVTNRCGF